MTVSSIGGTSAMSLQAIADMRNQLDDLQRQLGTGKKSDTYAGLGLDRGLTVGLALAAVADHGLPGHHHPGRRAAQPHADRADAIQQRHAADQEHDPAIAVPAERRHPDAGSDAPSKARSTRCSACSTPRPTAAICSPAAPSIRQPVATTDHILNGDGLKAGLKQVIAERKQADLGASGLGRLTVGAPTAASMSLAEDAVSPFGFKLVGVDHHDRRRHRDRAGRRAAVDVGRSRRDQSERRRHRQVQLHAAGWHQRRI